MRNIGSSIGIALVQTLLVRNTQTMHAALTEKITIANPEALSSLATPQGAALLNNEITRQASMIAYVDDFWLMLILTLCVLPLLLLIRPAASHAASAPAVHAAHD